MGSLQKTAQLLLVGAMLPVTVWSGVPQRACACADGSARAACPCAASRSSGECRLACCCAGRAGAESSPETASPAPGPQHARRDAVPSARGRHLTSCRCAGATTPAAVQGKTLQPNEPAPAAAPPHAGEPWPTLPAIAAVRLMRVHLPPLDRLTVFCTFLV